MPKTKPVLVLFMEATYNITDNGEDYETLTSVKDRYRLYCASNNITPMAESIFLTVLLNKYPTINLTTILINEEETAVLTHISPI